MSEHPGFDLKVFGPVGGWFWPFMGGAEAQTRTAPSENPAQAFTAQLGQTLKAAGRCQLEIMAVTNRRAQAYLHLPGRLAACRLPSDFVEVQLEFWQQALGHYTEAAQHMADIAGLMLPKVPLREERKKDRDYIDFEAPLRTGDPKGVRAKAMREPQRRVA